LRTVFAAVVVLIAAYAVQAKPASASPVTFAPHKAIYAMSLAAAKGGASGIVDVRGKMLFEWLDSCEAWTTDQKFALQYVYNNGPAVQFASHYSAWEAKNGESYSFSVRRLRNGEISEEIRGSAVRAPDGTGSATFSKPAKTTIELAPGVVFPTAHTLKMLELASQGERFYNTMMFDGSDGEGPVEINVFIGQVTTERGSTNVKSDLLTRPARHVRMAFFPSDGDSSQPEYEMTLTLLDNGVVSELKIEYEDFTLKGLLESIEAVAAPRCS
jgi:hypothetical protein